MKYEYITTSRMYVDEEYLNEYGSKGWELIQVIEGEGRLVPSKLIWKRSVREVSVRKYKS